MPNDTQLGGAWQWVVGGAAGAARGNGQGGGQQCAGSSSDPPQRQEGDEPLLSLPAECGRVMLLSGPNMGGKSTLLRQVCLAIILAQVRTVAGSAGS